MRTLQLVTTPGPFFNEQVRVLEQHGVSCTVLDVPQRGDSDRTVLEYAAYYPQVLGTAVAKEFDIIHANYGLTAPMALGQPTRPVILSLWGSDVHGTFGPLSRFCAKFADEVVVMSAEMAEAVGGEPAVIPHGVDLERFQPRSRDEALAEVGWSADSMHVLFPWGEDRVVKDYPRARRVVEAAREQLTEQVELHAVSGVPHERMPAYMNAADVLLMTSKWEGSPNAVREALACNLPVVVTDVGDVSEHVCDLPVSSVCTSDRELVDGLVFALESGRPSDHRKAVRDLSLEQTAADLLDVYERALS